ncbi:hypothetical protein OROGR_010069 [Orobanche gracilis]
MAEAVSGRSGNGFFYTKPMAEEMIEGNGKAVAMASTVRSFRNRYQGLLSSK